jgi:hypothetical protein
MNSAVGMTAPASGSGAGASAPALGGTGAMAAVDGGIATGAGGVLAAGTGGGTAAGLGGMAAPIGGSSGAARETCAAMGAMRCAATGSGQREVCAGGYWAAGVACAAGQTCTATGTCAAIAELCRGSAGEAVCDAQGALLMCNADATLGAQQMCKSAAHCRAGLASRGCATCIPNQEYHCAGVTLQVCAADGMSFTKMTDCPTEGLCNEALGQCSTAVCAPGKTTCAGDTLKTCNADGTAFASQVPCGAGLCDGIGGDCNLCQPGEKTCDSTQKNVLTCNAQGQSRDSAPCANNAKCVGAGKCVACTLDSDCPDPGACKERHCNTAAGTCEPVLSQAHTHCSNFGIAGFCSASGSCLGCVDRTDCTTTRAPICDTLSSTCVACNATEGCRKDQTCALGSCSDNLQANCVDRPSCPSCVAGVGYCSASCTPDDAGTGTSTPSNCPTEGGRLTSLYCASNYGGYCVYSCSNNDADCPVGSICKVYICAPRP